MWDELSSRFPELRPVSGVPLLFNLFGCGLLLYGRRDEDPETGTFLRTRFLCVVFVPVAALGSYRMGQTEQGWVILGREPISAPAMFLNLITLLFGLGGGGVYGVHAMINADWYVARGRLAEASRLAAAGEAGKAAELYESVATGPTEYAPAAAERLAAMAERPEPGWPSADLAAVFLAATRVQKEGRWPKPAASLYDAGMLRVNALAATDPRGACRVLDAVSPLAPKGDDPTPLARDLLERAVAAAPDDVETASRLAVLYEAQNQLDRCTSLLERHRARLGPFDGASILARIDAQAGRVESALTLLRAYTRPRLVRLRECENRMKAAVVGAETRLVEQLRSRTAPDFDYDAARHLGDAELQRKAGEYINARLKTDPEVRRSHAAMEGAAGVVPAALDFGILLLGHAQGLPDPDARRKELAEAEETFLAVSRLAGEDEKFQIALGQVYYWEGKSREGRAEFDKVLAARHREPALLLAIADLLREVGVDSEARALAEEGYKTATEPKTKRGCAALRGLLESDPDSRVEWLNKSDPSDPFSRALLATENAFKAFREGNEVKGLGHLKEAAGLYQGIPESAETLNNASIVEWKLGELTGDDAGLERSASMIERAAALQPGNSLTASNAAETRLKVALADIIGRSLDLKALRRSGDFSLLSYLYDDQAGHDALARRVAGHPGVVKAVAMLEKVVLLAPKRTTGYQRLLSVHGFTNDLEGLRALRRRVEGADFDLVDDLRQEKELAAGTRDDARGKALRAAVAEAGARLLRVRSLGHGPTLAVALDTVAGGELASPTPKSAVDRDATVALAEEAYRLNPSSGTRSLLGFALLSRAEGRVAAANAAYADVVERTRRTVLVDARIAALLSVDGPLTQALAADPDVARAADLVRLKAEKYPQETGSMSWAMLRVTHPDTAARVAKEFSEREADRLQREVSERLEPYDSRTVLGHFWADTMAGRGDAAAGVLRTYKAFGLPLPIEAP